MNTSNPPGTPKGWMPRCFELQCTHIDSWENRAAEPERQFVLRLALASAEELQFDAGGNWVLYLGAPLEVDFLFDTGADVTVLSREVADELGMRFDGEPMWIPLPGASSAPFWQASVYLGIAANWLEVRCLVPCFTDTLRPPVNLLGMEGLLEKHLFCLGHDELHLLRRPRP